MNARIRKKLEKLGYGLRNKKYRQHSPLYGEMWLSFRQKQREVNRKINFKFATTSLWGRNNRVKNRKRFRALPKLRKLLNVIEKSTTKPTK
jgi:hypothetical protein